ncbi:MAG: sialate O-acetylesterase [Verrucomicrobiae bacterium]|nr:sialate O-acetylesterase [Verrucomicrobiae bacterium]NNJ42166.1 sialate O-acetylesterase [Akkermansiaceae bacterium]
MKYILPVILTLSVTLSLRADVVLPSIISDHMILQSGAVTTIWGTAEKGEQVTVEFAGQHEKATTDAMGNWNVKLTPLRASSIAQKLTVTGENKIVVDDVLVGESWLASGQSNMATGIRQSPGHEKAVFRAQKDNPRVRAFLNGRWILCSEQVLSSSAVAFFFALKLEQKLDVPVGYIIIAQNGSRIEPFIPEAEHKAAGIIRKGSSIHNTRIMPIVPSAIKGVIWYQGESNHGSDDYFESIKALSAGWSRVFSYPNIPLHMVQVAPFDYSRKGVPSSVLADSVWAAQYRAAKEVPGVSVIPIHDTHINVKKIHPRHKQPVGERLAAMALKRQYGKDVVTSGPIFSKATRKQDKVLVSFSNIDQGLTTKDGNDPRCFELSADGKEFVSATATVQGTQVIVHSDKVPAPQFVRMGWFDTAIPTLRDKNGWPAHVFPAQMVE